MRRSRAPAAQNSLARRVRSQALHRCSSSQPECHSPPRAKESRRGGSCGTASLRRRLTRRVCRSECRSSVREVHWPALATTLRFPDHCGTCERTDCTSSEQVGAETVEMGKGVAVAAAAANPYLRDVSFRRLEGSSGGLSPESGGACCLGGSSLRLSSTPRCGRHLRGSFSFGVNGGARGLGGEPSMSSGCRGGGLRHSAFSCRRPCPLPCRGPRLFVGALAGGVTSSRRLLSLLLRTRGKEP